MTQSTEDLAARTSDSELRCILYPLQGNSHFRIVAPPTHQPWSSRLMERVLMWIPISRTCSPCCHRDERTRPGNWVHCVFVAAFRMPRRNCACYRSIVRKEFHDDKRLTPPRRPTPRGFTMSPSWIASVSRGSGLAGCIPRCSSR
jgi:hypothetical protein